MPKISNDEMKQIKGKNMVYLLRGICIGTESRQFAPALGLIFLYIFPGVGTTRNMGLTTSPCGC